MYARFFRWASDRIDENGIVAFVTNRSFIESRTFDGFRKMVANEFNEIWVVDLGGDVRADPRLSGTRNNVFGIQTGVAISFMVKRANAQGCRIRYARRPQLETAEEKRAFLADANLQRVTFEEIEPTDKHDWINIADTNTADLVTLIDKGSKASGRKVSKVIFDLFSNGVVTARDEWMTNFDPKQLQLTAQYFCDKYDIEQIRWLDSPLSKVTNDKKRLESLSDFVSREIKWTSELENHLDKGTKINFLQSRMRNSSYRPYVNNYCYYSRVLTHRLYRQNDIFPVEGEWQNLAIGFSGLSSSKLFHVLAVDRLPSYDFLEKTQFVPRYKYDSHGRKEDNITDWALDQFHARYEAAETPNRPITKDAIFHYVYGVLHDPVYREKYALNLKREFPRIPFYADFWVLGRLGRTADGAPYRL